MYEFRSDGNEFSMNVATTKVIKKTRPVDKQYIARSTLFVLSLYFSSMTFMDIPYCFIIDNIISFSLPSKSISSLISTDISFSCFLVVAMTPNTMEEVIYIAEVINIKEDNLFVEKSNETTPITMMDNIRPFSCKKLWDLESSSDQEFKCLVY